MKKYFVTGVVILLPLALTAIIVIFLINLLTEPFIGFVQSALDHYGFTDTQIFLFNTPQVQLFISRVLILIVLFLFTLSLGALARWFFFNSLLKMWDYLIHKIPFVRTVYKTSQDVINTILTTDTRSFKQVVVVPFPSADSHSVGLVTRENIRDIPHRENESLVAVFVPTTPNPTSGFLMLYPEEDLIYLDMKVEEALKYIISCGVILNEPFKETTKEHAKNIQTPEQTES